MKQTRIAAGLVLAFASTAALAASGDRWYGANHNGVREPVVIERVVTDRDVVLYPDRELVYVERDVRPAPVIVEREYVVTRPAYVVRDHDPVKALNPETGHYIGAGLFNRWGPNDFGS